MKQCLRTIIFILVPLLVSARDGDSLFTGDKIHSINIVLSQPGFWDSLVANYSTDTYMMGQLEVNGVMMDSVGIKLKGNSSYNSVQGNKKSFKLGIDEYKDQKVNGLKTLNLNNGFKDPTLIREKLTLDFLRSMNLPAPRCNYAKVYINGVYWGLYTLVEQVNKTFLNDVIGNKNGNLFKGDPQGSLQWYGSADSLYYSKYELKTNETLNDWSDLVKLINVINNTPAGSLQDSIEKYMNIDSYVKSWAVYSAFANLDSYMGSGHNYYIYHNTATGKFEWISWDVNESFGNFNMGMNVTQLENLSYSYLPQNGSRPLNQKILANAGMKQKYIEALCEVLTLFDPTVLNSRIDTLADLIRTDLYADPNKFYTNQQFEQNLTSNLVVMGTPGGGNIAGLKSFVQNRSNSLSTQLGSACISGTQRHESQALNVYPKIFHENFYVEGSAGQFQIVDIYGRIMNDYIIATTSTGFKVTMRAASNRILFIRDKASGSCAKLVQY